LLFSCTDRRHLLPKFAVLSDLLFCEKVPTSAPARAEAHSTRHQARGGHGHPAQTRHTASNHMATAASIVGRRSAYMCSRWCAHAPHTSLRVSLSTPSYPHSPLHHPILLLALAAVHRPAQILAWSPSLPPTPFVHRGHTRVYPTYSSPRLSAGLAWFRSAPTGVMVSTCPLTGQVERATRR
jgi:hypothetical protein